MERSDGDRTFVMVSVRDCEDTRLFIELASYGSDLAEAGHALDLAIQGDDQEGSDFAEARAYLIGFAVVAYCRTILHSKVRRPLTDHVDVPAELQETHQQVKSFRNATIAHSQSELTVTYPVGVLDSATLDLVYVAGATVISTLPRAVVQRFQTLLEAMDDLVDAALEPVRARLEATMRQVDPRALLADPRPTVLEKFEDEFNPRTTRRPYPTSHTIYWQQISQDGDPNDP